MKNICNLLLNVYDNDTRVKKIFATQKEIYKNNYLISITNNKIPKNYILTNRIYKIYQKPLNNIKPLFLRYWEWQFNIRYKLFKIFKYINIKQKFDIIYCNDFDTLITVFFLKKKYEFKIIYDTHELWAERSGSKKTLIHKILNKIEYILEYYIISRVDLVITVSDGIAEELVRRYHIKKPLVIRNLDIIKPLPSENERLRLRRELNIPANCILLVYQGGMHKSRGIYELIEAMEQLDNNIHLLLMGPKPKDDILNRINKNNRIHYIGMIPENKLYNYTCIGDIGIAAIHTKGILSYKLALPNKFSQYMNGALALALYDNIEARKIIERGKCGEIFNSDDVNSIVQAINKIINSGKLNEYKKRSRELFLKEYNWDIDKYKLLKEIKRL